MKHFVESVHLHNCTVIIIDHIDSSWIFRSADIKRSVTLIDTLIILFKFSLFQKDFFHCMTHLNWHICGHIWQFFCLAADAFFLYKKDKLVRELMRFCCRCLSLCVCLCMCVCEQGVLWERLLSAPGVCWWEGWRGQFLPLSPIYHDPHTSPPLSCTPAPDSPIRYIPATDIQYVTHSSITKLKSMYCLQRLVRE